MNTIKVMTFNIRYGQAKDGMNHWDHRKELVIDRIRTFDPDLLGLQECRDDEQAEFIKQNLPDYDFFGVRRGGTGETALEMAPLLVRRSAFHLRDHGNFWLSVTPEIPGSRSWDSAFPRTVTWAGLNHLSSGRSLIFLNTHVDYMPAANDASTRLLLDWIDRLDPPLPVILTGDFNAIKDSATYRQLAKGGRLADAYRQVHPSSAAEGTFHGFGLPGVLLTIDWIVISKEFETLEAFIDTWHEGDRYPSDHYPVITTLRWQP
jgi:endonuclease/exonuclease/phosphatase family metal-dependent hydrolase